MSKEELLDYLARMPGADATQVASAFGRPYPAVAMALLRLTRQGLVQRFVDRDTGCYWYELSERGQERLAYFQS